MDKEKIQNCFVDFVGFTLKFETTQDGENVIQLASDFCIHLIKKWFPFASFIDTGRGWSGYAKRIDIEGVGLAAYGGNGDTLHFEITGSGCAQISNWNEFADDLESVEAKITRCDLAHDDLDGQTFNIPWARNQYQTSGFKPSRGLSPKCKLISDEGSGDGCTFYVGKRENGKMARIYDKGKEQGDPTSPWVRVEVEWRAVHRKLEYDMLRDPSTYLSGSYPCLSILSNVQTLIKTVQFKAAAALDKAVEHAKTQAGRVLRALVEIVKTRSGDQYVNDTHLLEAVKQVIRPDIPPRLAYALHNITQLKHVEHSDTPPHWWVEPTAKDRERTARMLDLDFKFWSNRSNHQQLAAA